MAGFSPTGLGWTAVTYAVGMFFVTAGYHRYFSHRTYQTSRVFQFILAFGAQMTCQKGVLWWASHHRHHHKHSDTENDVHSLALRGFWWSHVGWILSSDWQATHTESVRDLTKYPELRALNHPAIMLLPGIAYGALMYLVAGIHGLAYGAMLPLVLLWHGTFTINSLTHKFGKKVYDSGDESKNNFVLALITHGEGWHNNHHYYQRSCRQSFHWWQIDVTYYVLWALSKLRVVRKIHNAPTHVIEGRPTDKRAELATMSSVSATAAESLAA